MSNCLCGSNISEDDCCRIYISGERQAETPEKLMRSRYTAYTEANMDYILKTMQAPASNHFDAESAKKWAKSVHWLRLNVLSSTAENRKGFVEFIAYYIDKGKESCIHEISEFHQINSTWYYVDGRQIQPKVCKKLKMGRNDPCHCGSGKKYKACCLPKG